MFPPHSPSSAGPHPRGEQGVALPLALLGLVMISLLLIMVLVGASTESAISGAHRDATASLYDTESALQQFVAEHAGEPLDPWIGTAALVGGAELRVVRLRDNLSATRPERTFAITAAGADGRTLVAMVRQTQHQLPDIDTGQLAGAATITGGLLVRTDAARVSGGPDPNAPSSCTPGVQAIRSAAGAEIVLEGSTATRVSGFRNGSATYGSDALDPSGLAGLPLLRQALGLGSDQMLDDVVARIPADSRFGPRFRTPGQPVRSFHGTVPEDRSSVVVDAAGGTVDLKGGSGLLIVLNGDVRMRDAAAFQGLLIVEGNATIEDSAELTGALIALSDHGGSSAIGSPSGSGSAVLRHDACTVLAAQQAFNQLPKPTQTFATSHTFGWWEVVR